MSQLSRYLSKLLRHQPELLDLDYDGHGYVRVNQLIERINERSRFTINKQILDDLVESDQKGRFKYSEDGLYIKACQGHTIPIEVELHYKKPPDLLYHGTTMEAYELIKQSGYIDKMHRHDVHLQESEDKAWQSARRWKHKTPILLEIDAKRMYEDAYQFGITDNGVWCIKSVPIDYINRVIYRS